ncbi:MAG: PhoU domain-containing protein [Candidatus Verstraetearchaeota archaeon]|nr:PhoU domain-containing protein [Candidatus Verstraetearchaeota archaeon]
MEYRRLQMSKGGSYLLSLPKEWVKENGLQGGAILRLTVSDGELRISADAAGEGEKGSVAYIKRSEGLERQIRSNYLYGADSIVIELGRRLTPSVREEIKGAIQKLIGLEIVEEDRDTVTIQCLLQPTSMPVTTTIRRAYTLAASMHKDAEEALLSGDLELASSVERRDDEVDRLYFLIVRQLRLAVRNPAVSEKLGIRPAECLDYRMAAKYVETIADYAGAVAASVPKTAGADVDKELMDALGALSRESFRTHERAANALFKRDLTLADTVLEEGKGLGQHLLAVNELLMSKQPRIAALLDSIAIYFYQIGAHGVDLAELVSGAPA